ncbi:unnamed protein product [Laminaria digitata]
MICSMCGTDPAIMLPVGCLGCGFLPRPRPSLIRFFSFASIGHQTPNKSIAGARGAGVTMTVFNMTATLFYRIESMEPNANPRLVPSIGIDDSRRKQGLGGQSHSLLA